jgi:hypothetical protein
MGQRESKPALAAIHRCDERPMHENKRKAWVKGGGARAIGSYIARLLDPVARARGFATTALLTEWPAIVGADLAAFTMPDKVVWPRRVEGQDPAGGYRTRRAEGATLVLRVDGPRAIEVQYRAGQILDRVNTYFGYRAVADMRILQAPVTRAARQPVAPPVAIDETALPASATIEDQGLRTALLRLGTGIRAKQAKE